MTDIKSRLVDGMRGQGVRLPDGDWLRLNNENRTLIAERLLSLPGIAIVSAEDIRRALHQIDPGASLDEQRVRAKAQLALLAAAVQAQEPK